MDAQTLLRANGAKAGELVIAIGNAAGAIAKAIEDAAGPLAEMIEEKAETLAKGVEERTTPLAEAVSGAAVRAAVGAKVETLAKKVEERATPLAGAVGTGVEALAGDLEEKIEQARREVTKSVKSFRFGTREGVVLGMALGVFAAVWLIRRMDRQAARERLAAAGSKVGQRTQALADRVGEAAQGVTSKVGPTAQGLTSRVGEVTHGLTDKAGEFASQAGEKVGQVAQTVGTRAGEMLQQVRGQGERGGTSEGSPLRASDPTSPVREVVISDSHRDAAVGEEPAGPGAPVSRINAERLAESGLDKDTQEAINDVVQQVERVEGEALEEAQKLGLSAGMKVVAFDGTDIGRVQEVREEVFVLDRPRGADLLVPLTEVARIEGTVAYLRIEVGQVPKMGWETADKS